MHLGMLDMAKIKLWIRMRRKGDLRLLMWHDYGGRWVDPSTSQIADLQIFPHNHDLGLERMVRKKRKYQASVSSLGEKMPC